MAAPSISSATAAPLANMKVDTIRRAFRWCRENPQKSAGELVTFLLDGDPSLIHRWARANPDGTTEELVKDLRGIDLFETFKDVVYVELFHESDAHSKDWEAKFLLSERDWMVLRSDREISVFGDYMFISRVKSRISDECFGKKNPMYIYHQFGERWRDFWLYKCPDGCSDVREVFRCMLFDLDRFTENTAYLESLVEKFGIKGPLTADDLASPAWDSLTTFVKEGLRKFCLEHVFESHWRPVFVTFLAEHFSKSPGTSTNATGSGGPSIKRRCEHGHFSFQKSKEQLNPHLLQPWMRPDPYPTVMTAPPEVERAPLSAMRTMTIEHALLWCREFPDGSDAELVKYLLDGDPSSIHDWARANPEGTRDEFAMFKDLRGVDPRELFKDLVYVKLVLEHDDASKDWEDSFLVSQRDWMLLKSSDKLPSEIKCPCSVELSLKDIVDEEVFGNEDPLKIYEQLEDRWRTFWIFRENRFSVRDVHEIFVDMLGKLDRFTENDAYLESLAVLFEIEGPLSKEELESPAWDELTTFVKDRMRKHKIEHVFESHWLPVFVAFLAERFAKSPNKHKRKKPGSEDRSAKRRCDYGHPSFRK